MRTSWLRVAGICLLSGVSVGAVAQQGKGFTPAFEVVSIKPSRPNGPIRIAPSVTGYETQGQTLWGLVMAAYFPKSLRYWYSARLQAPDWIKDANYDVIAKLDAATIEQWKGLTMAQRQQAMMPLLQKMLAERCKLVAHTVPAETQGFALVKGRHGTKLIPSKPDAAKPSGVALLPDGGWRIVEPSTDRTIHVLKLRSVTMAQLAELLVRTGERPVEDMTGLKGRYDVDLPLGEDTSDMVPSIWDLSGVGLELKAGKVPTVNVVVDHIERPTTN